MVTIRELSQEQQLKWIERLFSRLQAMYGNSFTAMWANSDIAEVKSIWAEKLGGFTADQIAYGLKALDEKPFPPNLPEFITLCRRYAISTARRLENKPISKDEAARFLANLAARIDLDQVPRHRQWAIDLLEREAAGEILLPIVSKLAHEAMKAEAEE